MFCIKRFLGVFFLFVTFSGFSFALEKSNYFVIETDSDYNTTWLACIDSFDSTTYFVDSSDKDSGIIQGKMNGMGGTNSKDSFISVKVREKDNKRIVTVTDRPGKITIYIKKSQKPILIYINKLQENLSNAVITQQE